MSLASLSIEPAVIDDSDETIRSLRLSMPIAPKVLLVDDDPHVLARLGELVAAEGYDVRAAASGPDALEVLEDFPASVVITDLNMPAMSGLELCRRIRERSSPGYVFIIMLTVRDEERDILAGLDAGADDYLSKRTSAALFRARLRSARRVLTLEYSLTDALEKKHQLAMADALTGAYNRRYFKRHLDRALKRAQRFGGHVSLLLVDIDHFKQINDTWGHAVGDLVLRELTQRIGKCLQRETDWCARLGGDEFAVVLEGTRTTEARVCAERLRQAIADAAIDTPVGVVRITISIGVASLREGVDREGATLEALVEIADANLYASKAGGRNRVGFSRLSARGARGRSAALRIQRADHANEKAALSPVR